MRIQQFLFRSILAAALSAGALGSAWASAQEALNNFVKNRGFAEGQFSQVVISPSGAVKQRGTGEFSFFTAWQIPLGNQETLSLAVALQWQQRGFLR